MWTQITAWLLSFLSIFAIWSPNGQPNKIPETRAYEGDGTAKYDIWPTEDFTAGKAPFLLPQAAEALYDLKGLIDGGAKTEGLLVLHKGKLVHESYAEGWDKDKAHVAWSVTKSVTATLVGIAIHEGLIKGIDQKVIDFFPEAVLPAGQESKKDMTIEHLLTMTSGIVTDTDEAWAGYYAKDVGDAALYAFLQPQKTAPGKKYVYENMAPTILLGIVGRAAKQDVLDYAEEKLFAPLGMKSVTWETTQDGLPMGGFGIWMTPRDMLRLGYLYLNYGLWDGKQIFSPAWAAQAGPRSMAPNAYGHTFWNNEVLPLFGFYEADGMYGQFISVYPSLDMVIVRTGTTGPLVSWFLDTTEKNDIRFGSTIGRSKQMPES